MTCVKLSRARAHNRIALDAVYHPDDGHTSGSRFEAV